MFELAKEVSILSAIGIVFIVLCNLPAIVISIWRKEWRAVDVFLLFAPHVGFSIALLPFCNSAGNFFYGTLLVLVVTTISYYLKVFFLDRWGGGIGVAIVWRRRIIKGYLAGSALAVGLFIWLMPCLGK